MFRNAMWVRVSKFQTQSVTNVCNVIKPKRYKGLGGCQISRKKCYILNTRMAPKQTMFQMISTKLQTSLKTDTKCGKIIGHLQVCVL